MSNFDLQLNEELEKLKKKKKQNTPQLNTFDSQLNEELEHLKKYGTNTGKDTGKYKDRQDDIAPVRTVGKLSGQEEEKEKERTWFKASELWDDGYQFGDITKTILGTGEDLANNVGAGLVGIGEKVVDALVTVAPYVTQGMYYANGGGYNIQADTAFRQAIDTSKAGTEVFVKKDLYDEQKVAERIIDNNLIGMTNKALGVDSEAHSVSGAKMDSLAQSGGQLLGQLAANAVAPGSGMALMGVTAFGSEAEGALQNGATLDEAALSGAVSAGAEMLTEKIGGISFGGKTLTDAMFNNLSRHMTSKLAKILITTGKVSVDALAEGGEEILSGYMSAIGQKLTYMSDKEITELFSNEDLLESFIGGAVLGGLGGAGDAVGSVVHGVDPVSGLNKSEAAVVEKVFNDLVAEKEANGKKLTNREKNKLYDTVVKDMEKGIISTDTIEEVLGGDSYKAYKDSLDSESALKDEQKALQEEQDTLKEEYAELNKKVLTGEVQDRREAIKSRQTEIDTRLGEIQKSLNDPQNKAQRDLLKAKLDKDVYELTKNDKLRESFYEVVRSKQKFQADLNQYKGKEREIIKQVMDSGLADNSNQTHEFWDLMAKLSSTGDTTISIADSAQILDMVKAEYEANGEVFDPSKFEGQIIDGYISKNGIVLNAESKRALNFVVGHEITHKLEKTKHYSKLQQLLFEFAEDEYQKRFNTRAGQYANKYAADAKFKSKIDMEVTGDLVGDYLFTNKDFVTHLAKDQNVFQQVWNEIKYLAKIATAGSEQAKQLEKVKREFERAWRESSKNTTDIGAKYSLENNGKKKYNKRSKYSETETLFLSWENGAAPVGEVKKFARFGKTRYYQKTESGSVELSKRQYIERAGVYAENIDRRAERELSEAFDYDEITQRGSLGDHIGNRNAGGNAAIFGQTIREELPDVTGGSESSTIRNSNGNPGINQTEYNDEASEKSDASFVTFSNDYATIRNFMKDGDKGTKDNDVSFSLSEAVEETKDLVALHNLSEDKLLKSLELGGLPMPSLAITKADIPHSNFGEITLIFGRETIDPKANKKNKVYSADAWTPVFPRVEYEADTKVESRISQKLREIGSKIDEQFKRELNMVSHGYEDYLNRNGGEEGLVERVMDNYGMKAAYLEDQGKHIDKITKQEEVEKGYNPLSADKYDKILDILGVSTPEEIKRVNLRDAVNNHGAELEAVYPGVTQSALRLGRILGVVQSYLEQRNTGTVYRTVNDVAAMKKSVDDAIDTEGYEAWVRNLFSGIVKDSGIYNNKDVFTPSGNRRTFKQTHLPVTLENIVKAMASQNGGNSKNVSGFNGVKTLRAATAETFKSVEEMHQKKGRLQNLTHEQFDAVSNELQSRLYNVIEAIDNESGHTGGDNSFIRFDSIGEILAEIGESGKYSVADIQRIFKQYGRNISDDTTLEVKQLLYEVAQMPVNIFEAKPQRVVNFDEAKVFVIPRTADTKLKQELLNRGFSIAEYNPDVEGDRQKVVNRFEEYQFSLSDAGETHRKYGDWNVYSNYAPMQETVSETESVAPVVISKNETTTVTPEEMRELFPDDLSQADMEMDNLLQQKESLEAKMLEMGNTGDFSDFDAVNEEYLRVTGRLAELENEVAESEAGRIGSLDDAAVPPETEAPYVESGNEAVENPFEDRDWYNVGNQKVKAYMYENPEVKPFFQEEALGLMSELRDTTRGERYYNDQAYLTGGNEEAWTGVSRHTSKSMEILLDSWGMSYADIEKGLNAIIEDNGAENIAAAKKIEFMLNDRLLNGYTDFYSNREVPPNQDYINLLAEKQINEYSKEAFDSFMANADQYAPADIAPVKAPTAVSPYDAMGAAPYGFDPITELQYKYGNLPDGEHPVREDSMPKSITGKDRVSLTARTVKGAGATPDEFVDLLHKETLGGRFSYIPITNSDTVQKAYNEIVKKGWEAARGEWETKVRRGEVSAELTATGSLLLNHAAKAEDRNAWLSVLHDYQIMGTNAGQAVQAMRILKTLTPDDSLYMIERSVEQMVEDMKLGTEIVIDENLKQNYLNAKTDGERDAARQAIAKDVARQIPSTAMDKWTARRYLNMLGNFRTQVRNIFGNFGMSVTTGVRNTVATSIEWLANKASGGKFHRTKSIFVNKGQLKAARNDFENVKTVALNGGKFNDPMAKSLQFQQEVQDARRIFKFAPLEGYRRATNWAMDTGDLVFSKMAYGRALAGYLKANGIKETDFSKIDQKTLDEARAYAINEAQETTFRDNNWLSSWVSKLGRGKNTPKGVKIVSEGVMPFRKTPANILLRAEEYSPLGLVNATVKSIQAAKGNATGADVVNSWAKALTGTGLFALGMWLNNSGMLSGGPDEDDDKEWFENQYGWQNYAIQIGDKNYTIDFLSPAAMPLLMGAQLNELRQNSGVELKDLEKALLSIADPMIEMSMLQGLNDTLDNIRYAESNMGQFIVNACVSYLTQGLTNSFLGQLERSFEGQRMSTYTDKDSDLPAWLQKALGKASAKTPGWDYQQIPYIDAWGETEDIAPLPGFAENALSPSYISQGITDAVYEELNRLNDAQSDINVYPQTPDKTVTFDDIYGRRHEDYNLSAEEYVELAQLQGKTQKKLVEDILSNYQYSGLNDKEKARAVQLAYQYAKEYSRKAVLGADGFSSKWMAKAAAEGDIVNAIIAHTNDEKTFAYENPEKYQFFTENGISWDDYDSADAKKKQEYSDMYSWVSDEDHPGRYSMAKAVSDDFQTFWQYKSDCNNFDAKDENGETVNGLKKERVIDYINGLDIDYGAKIILFRSMYDGKKDKEEYDQDIIDYLNSREDISNEDMEAILKELG